MQQPLVTRPAYGHGGLSTVAESKLPSGGPGGKGMPLDPGIPGSATYAKPEGDVREPRKDDEPIKRVDNADDLTKERSRIDTREDNADKHDGIGGLGKGEWSTTIKTKYPYRDKRPHEHYASVDPAFVAALFELRTAHELVLPPEPTVKVALRLGEVMQGLNPKTLARSKKCAVKLKRADIPNLRWIFAVDCGNGPKAIKLKADRKGNVVAMTKLELAMKCSCEAWRWLGSEYHAKGERFIDGKPRGTASTPDIKDPRRVNRVCKHVAAVLNHVKAWTIPKKKK
jgi:hypothetical protein